MSNSKAVWSGLAACLTVLALSACGQRGPLYIPGKPGDPYFDRQNRGASPAPGTARDSIKPAPSTSQPTAPPRREDDGNTNR